MNSIFILLTALHMRDGQCSQYTGLSAWRHCFAESWRRPALVRQLCLTSVFLSFAAWHMSLAMSRRALHVILTAHASAGLGARAERHGVAARARGAGRRRRGGRRRVGAALRRAARGVLAAGAAAGAGRAARRRGRVWRDGPGFAPAARRARERPPRSMEGAPTRIHMWLPWIAGAFVACW